MSCSLSFLGNIHGEKDESWTYDVGKYSPASKSSTMMFKTDNMYFSMMCSSDIQRLLNESLSNMSKPWMDNLHFPMFKWCAEIDQHEMFSHSPEELDIAKFLNGNLPDVEKSYFCPQGFPHQPPRMISKAVLVGRNCAGNWRNLPMMEETKLFVMTDTLTCLVRL